MKSLSLLPQDKTPFPLRTNYFSRETPEELDIKAFVIGCAHYGKPQLEFQDQDTQNPDEWHPWTIENIPTHDNGAAHCAFRWYRFRRAEPGIPGKTLNSQEGFFKNPQ